MPILAISGSASSPGSNTQLLEAIAAAFPAKELVLDHHICTLPLYRPDLDKWPLPPEVQQWRLQVAASRAVLISTPEYLHNIPAVLKNGLEWLKSSGELHSKPLLPITFTPLPPRGEDAMMSLRKSLQALEARIVVELPLYQHTLPKNPDGSWRLEGEVLEWLATALEML